MIFPLHVSYTMCSFLWTAYKPTDLALEIPEKHLLPSTMVLCSMDWSLCLTLAVHPSTKNYHIASIEQGMKNMLLNWFLLYPIIFQSTKKKGFKQVEEFWHTEINSLDMFLKIISILKVCSRNLYMPFNSVCHYLSKLWLNCLKLVIYQ